MAEATSKLSILVELRDQATQAMRGVTNAVEDMAGSMGFAGDKTGMLAGAFAALGSTIIGKSMSAYSEAAGKLRNAQGIFSQLPDGIKKYQDALKVGDDMLIKYGFDNEDVVLGLAKFARAAGGDMKQALAALQASMGLSIEKFGGTGGLSQAVDALLPAFAGGGRAVKALGFEIDDNAGPMASFAKITEATAGELENFGKSAGGQISIMKSFGGEIMEGMGQPFVEARGKMMSYITENINLAKALEVIPPIANALGESIGIVTTLLAFKALPQIFNTISGFLGLGVTVSSFYQLIAIVAPWVGLIALITAVILAVTYLVKHWEQTKDSLKFVWETIKETAEKIWNSIIKFFQDIPENLGKIFGAMTMVIVKAFEWTWNKLKEIVPALIGDLVGWFAALPEKIINALAVLPNRLSSLFSNAASDIKGIINGIIQYVANAPNSIVDFGKSAINKFIDFVNGFVSGFNSKVPGFLQLPTIPKLADGGIVTRPTLSLIGEAGAEAVIPLSRLGGMGAGGGGINIYLQGDFYTTTEIAEKFGNAIARIIKYQLKI